jgi:hypothetical protein
MSSRHNQARGSVLSLARYAIAAVLVAATGAFAIGCGGGIEPGDYVIYRVAVTGAKQGSSCFPPDKVIPPNTKSDSNTFLGSTDFIVYAGLDEVFYLDTGAATLEGTLDGDTYTFSGALVNVEFANIDGTGDKTTDTLSTTVSMTVDGESVSGTVTNKHSIVCKGTTCADPFSCTDTQNFVGTEVDDIELKHDV